LARPFTSIFLRHRAVVFLLAAVIAYCAAGPVSAQQATTQPMSAPASAKVVNPSPNLPVIDVPPSNSAAVTTSSTNGIAIPAPPPPSALSPDAAQLAKQAEEAAARAQTTPAMTPGLTPADNSTDQLQADLKQQELEAEREQDHVRKSFDRAEHGLLPLSTDQIREFMRQLENTQRASQPPSGGPPKPEVKMTTLSLDPGVDPPQINLAAGYVTTITLVDATGEPWPIADVGVGGNFEVSPTQAGTHVVRVMPLTRITTGNLSILLKDLKTPIIFRLASGGPTIDMRYDARVPKLGPNAKVPLINRPLEAGSEAIMLVLDNAPPAGAHRMKVNGVDERTMAWMLDDHVYVRTPLTLLSPAWDASVSSADGTTVYEIGDAPVLLMSDNGAMVRARLVRDEDHDKQP
jgi:intracellular multiplication protein IcmK